jgi:hypothetical protein
MALDKSKSTKKKGRKERKKEGRKEETEGTWNRADLRCSGFALLEVYLEFTNMIFLGTICSYTAPSFSLLTCPPLLSAMYLRFYF